MPADGPSGLRQTQACCADDTEANPNPLVRHDSEPISLQPHARPNGNPVLVALASEVVRD
jgi:hypothetical protein